MRNEERLPSFIQSVAKETGPERIPEEKKTADKSKHLGGDATATRNCEKMEIFLFCSLAMNR